MQLREGTVMIDAKTAANDRVCIAIPPSARPKVRILARVASGTRVLPFPRRTRPMR